MALFLVFPLCFVPPYWSKDEGRAPEPGHSYWIKQIESHGFPSLLSMCFCPQRATKWHISSKVSAAELCISSGRKPTYRARHSLAYRLKLIAGYFNQFSRLARVGVWPGAAGTGALHIEWAQAHISSGQRPHIDQNLSQDK